VEDYTCETNLLSSGDDVSPRVGGDALKTKPRRVEILIRWISIGDEGTTQIFSIVNAAPLSLSVDLRQKELKIGELIAD